MMIRSNRTLMVVFTAALVFSLLSLSQGGVYSSKMLRRQDEARIVDIDSEFMQHFKLKESRQDRFRRDATTNRPGVKKFDLVNDTTHNQALIHWSGENSKVVFILTRKKSSSSSSKVTESTLWRSTDYGGEYQRMTSHFDKNTTLKSYFVCPTNKKKVIFVDAYNYSKRIWISEDEGGSYQPITVPFSMEKIEFHPENGDWLLGYDKLSQTLYSSQNFGRKWTKLHEHVTSERYYWHVKGVDTGDRASSTVHFEYRNMNLMPNKVIQLKSCFIPNCEETKFQKEFKALQNIDMDSLVVQDDYVFVQKSGAANKLYVSYKRGPYVKARFPYYPGNAQSHFHVVSSDGGCVVIGVNHVNGLTHLFFSNLEGDTYTQSLSNVRYYNRKVSDSKVYTIDIHEVQGIVGTYICNVHLSDGKGVNVTKITWDNGRSWSDILTAYQDNGDKIMGCTNCQLNLHISMDQTKSGYYMPSIITKKSVPGLIIAHGTFGDSVEDNPNHVAMFTSYDNGKTWNLARNQRHLVVVADHGAIIVAIKMIFLKPVTSLDFSSDYGRTWQTYTFTDTQVNVDGILTEPGESTHYLTLFGHKTYADSWRIFQLDMSPLFNSKICRHPEDFENITIPTQIDDKTCHLGIQQQVERLKIDVHCMIDISYKRFSSQAKCNCTEKDYECDLGYKYEKGVCQSVRNGPIDDIGSVEEYLPILRDEKCTDNMKNVSAGFRKIPGDKCERELYGLLWKVVNCDTTEVTTKSPLPPALQIQLVNKTSKAKMGENLMFSIQGASKEVVWHILRTVDQTKVPVKTPNDNLTLVAEKPGTYTVQVSLQGQKKYSNVIVVDFWYPIEKVYLYHPPVVARNKTYNATVWIGTTYGLRANKTMLGDVQYFWDMEANQYYSKNNMLVNLTHHDTKSVHIKVTAENTVSLQTTSGKIQVKEFVETLVLELHCVPERNVDLMTDLWLEEFKHQLKLALYTMTTFSDVMDKYKLQNEINLFIYVPPTSTLKVFLYVIPISTDDTKEQLLQAIKDIGKVISGANVQLLLAADQTVEIKTQYIIDHDGVVIMSAPLKTSSNGGVIAIGVIVAILLAVIIFFALRRVSKKMRFDRYLHFRNLRSSPAGSSHIVRNHDRLPIVDDEFIDDDLDTMEGIGSQDATLQFQG